MCILNIITYIFFIIFDSNLHKKYCYLLFFFFLRQSIKFEVKQVARLIRSALNRIISDKERKYHL